MTSITSGRRYLALWLPTLPTDRIARRASPTSGGPADKPRVLVEKIGNTVQVAALNRAAMLAGLRKGMKLADARARMATLDVEDMDRGADANLLSFFQRACLRYSPSIAPDGHDGLTIDITGCAHLFGGEDMLLSHILAQFQKWGMSVLAAIAGTAESAQAIARFGSGGVVSPEACSGSVDVLSIAALRLDAPLTSALVHLGLKTIGAVAARPRTPLTSRFGSVLIDRLDRCRGLVDVPPVNLKPMPPCWSEHRCQEPLLLEDDITRALHDLAETVVTEMERRGSGGRVFECLMFRTDGIVRSVHVEASRPVRTVQIVLQLFRERFAVLQDEIDPGFGFDLIRLVVDRLEPLPPEQLTLADKRDVSADADAVIDRLRARLGDRHVLRFAARDTHRPEHAAYMVPVIRKSSAHEDWASGPWRPLSRPLTLFRPPEPIEVTAAEAPDGPPARFQWRRKTHDVRSSEGPERIEPEWWAFSSEGVIAEARDYYRVEDMMGRRLWLYSQGSVHRRWFVHGLFA